MHFLREDVHYVFLTPFWGFRGTHAVHLRLIGKRVVDFLLVIELIIELFSLSVTATSENRLKIDFFEGVGQFRPNFRVERDILTILFARIYANECLTMSLTVYTHRNFIADFLPEKCNFGRKTAVLRFLSPLGAAYDVYLRLIGKRVMDFVCVNWTFFARCIDSSPAVVMWFSP